jgi:hypothetical protein
MPCDFGAAGKYLSRRILNPAWIVRKLDTANNSREELVRFRDPECQLHNFRGKHEPPSSLNEVSRLLPVGAAIFRSHSKETVGKGADRQNARKR